MVQLIMGLKGSGKTKRLVEMVATAVREETGSVVCIEKDKKLTYDIPYQARLIYACDYANAMGSYDFFKGFLSGLHAGNYDITELFIDGILKTCNHDLAGLGAFLTKVEGLAATRALADEGIPVNMTLCFTVPRPFWPPAPAPATSAPSSAGSTTSPRTASRSWPTWWPR